MSTSVWSELFGDSLATASGLVNTTEYLQTKKAVGLYFSAHWCPPCRGFTPELVKFYKNLSKSKDFEIVFLSSDRDEGSFNSYFNEMPWSALPFEKRDLKAKLSSKFGVSGIPMLIWLGPDGSIITKGGRAKVTSDPNGEEFPWYPQTVQDSLGKSFLENSTAQLKEIDLSDKIVFLYFSAHWCGPCQAFTPKLVSFYNKMKSEGKNLEIVFCTSDRTDGDFKKYYEGMPWLALPHGDKRIDSLSERFEVEGIPTLVVFDYNTGVIITKSGVESVRSDPQGLKYPFYPEPVEDLGTTIESYGCDLNSKPAIIIFMENSDDSEQAAAKEALTVHAEILAKAKADTPDGPEIIFFTSFGKCSIGNRLREMTQLPSVEKSENAYLLLLDIPDNGGYYIKELTEEITASLIGEYISDFKAGKLERLQLSK
eukprot:gene11863-15873_t